MTGSIRIAQITDCHLPADPILGYRGVDSYANLKTLVQKVKTLKPNFILASGDLSEDGSQTSYIALQQFFAKCGAPVLALPGNHDDAALLAQAFAGSPVDAVQVTDHRPWQIIRMNSCLPGKPHGRISEKSLTELENVLVQDVNRPRLLAVHHQPVVVGSPWIDKYRLFNPEAFLELVDKHMDVKAVVWGHIHQVFEANRNGTLMLGSPSSAINGLPGAQKFTPDPSGPACRWLELKADGTVYSKIISAKDD
jgi:Icc protein